jgi:hypothetical protein
MSDEASHPVGRYQKLATRVEFQRPGTSKLVGCLVYLVAAPFIAVFLTIFATVPLMIAVEVYGLSKNILNATFFLLLPVFGIGVAFWGYQDYRRRAALDVIIDPGGMSIAVDARQTMVPIEDVVSVRLYPTGLDFAYVLVLQSGRVLWLPPEVAPLSVVHDALESTLIPVLVHRLDEKLARGESIALEMSWGRLVGPISRACASLLVSPFLLVNPWRFLVGILVLRHAARVFRQSWLGIRGGFVLERVGLRSHADEEIVPWRHLERVRSDPVGLVLRSCDGETFALSTLTEDFWPVLRWINVRLK